MPRIGAHRSYDPVMVGLQLGVVEILAGLKTGEPVALLVERNGVFRYIAFEIE